MGSKISRTQSPKRRKKNENNKQDQWTRQWEGKRKQNTVGNKKMREEKEEKRSYRQMGSKRQKNIQLETRKGKEQ